MLPGDQRRHEQGSCRPQDDDEQRPAPERDPTNVTLAGFNLRVLSVNASLELSQGRVGVAVTELRDEPAVDVPADGHQQQEDRADPQDADGLHEER